MWRRWWWEPGRRRLDAPAACADSQPFSDTKPVAHADAEPDADAHSGSDAHADAEPDPDANSDPHAHAHAYAHTNSDTRAFGEFDAHQPSGEPELPGGGRARGCDGDGRLR